MGFLSRAIDNTVSNISSPEKRWHPAKWPKNKKDLEKWLITGKYGNEDIDIDEEDALSITAVWSAMMQLSTHPSSLPLHLYKSVDNGKKKASNHYQYNMLYLKPNPYMETMSFREALMYQMLRYGTAYAEKEFDGMGRIIRLWPLISRNVEPFIVDNELYYTIHSSDGKRKDVVLSSREVLKINGFSPDGLFGFNPICNNLQSIALTKAIEIYGYKFFINGARPAAVLEHPATLSQDAQERLRKNWDKIHQGLDNSHRIAILEEGLTLKEFSVTPEDSQTLDTRRFQIEEVARIFNMPVHMLKNLDRSTNNNIEFQGQEYVTYTLTPWLTKIEQAFTSQLLSEKEQKKYFYKHRVDGLLRGDPEKRHKTYAVGRQWGYYSANDIREMEDKNTIGKQGDIYLVPMNMTPADKINEVIDNSTKKNTGEPSIQNNPNKKSMFLDGKRIQNINIVRGRIHGSYIDLFQNSIRLIFNRESIAIQRASKKEKDIFEQWKIDFYNDHKNYIRKAIQPIIVNFISQISHQAYDEIFIEEEERNIDIDCILNEILNRYINDHIELSRSFIFGDNSKIEELIDKYSYDFAIRNVVGISNIVCSYIFNEFGYNAFYRTIKHNACEKCINLNSKQINKEDIFDINTCCCIVTI